MPLDLRDLRCFVAVYELRGFARAAKHLNTVQSSVSTRVRRLEHFIGATLFNRIHRNVTPTEKGVQLYLYARKVLDHVGELEDVVKREKPAA
jgi:DNA-binding transcriptional LysR family regulator